MVVVVVVVFAAARLLTRACEGGCWKTTAGQVVRFWVREELKRGCVGRLVIWVAVVAFAAVIVVVKAFGRQVGLALWRK